MRISDERHCGLLIFNRQILLIHRIKNNFEYWVTPGGHREEGETGDQTVVREIWEETGIEVKSVDLLYQTESHNGLGEKQLDFVYMCSEFNFQKPELIGEEKDRNKPENSYEPRWVSVNEIENINILPVHLKKYLINNFL